MNPKKKPRTSLYSDQLNKHWSNCSAGFEGLPSRNKEKFKYGGWEEAEEEKEEVEIIWSSSSEDEDKGVKDIRTLDTSSNRSRVVLLQNAPSGRKGECCQDKKRYSLPGPGKASMAFQRSKSPGKEDTSLEDFIVSDSGSDGDDGERLEKLGVQSPKDEPSDRTDIGTAGLKSVGVQEGPQRKGRKTTPFAGARSDKTAMSSHLVDRGKRRYAQSKQDLFEPEILDYDSPSEEESPAVSEPISDPSSASQSSWSRGQQNTSTTSSRANPNPLGSPRTGSEWVKKLKLQESITPERRSGGARGEETIGGGSTSGAGIVDSTRKKKKFVSSGLAERLQRLVSREKSSIAMWHHNRADSQNSQESTKSGLVVQVLSCEIHRGLYLTHCLTQVSSGSKVNAGSNVKGEGDQVGLSQGDEMYVFFTRSTGDKLGLAKGMLISIHTPWQKLSIPDVSKPVVLCTYLCRPLNLDPYDAVQGQPVLPECPTEGSKSPKVLNPVRLFPAASRSHSPGAEVVTNQENKIKNISASIMHGITETGACSSAGVSFKARVQRIVTRRQQTVVPHQSARMTAGRSSLLAQASPSLIKSLLLQDREGVVCEVQLTSQMAESSTWRQVLQLGEGRSYIFMNLRVTQRLTLARAPGLLSMIRSLQHRPNQMNGQTICYVLTGEVGVTAVESLNQSKSMDVPPLMPSAVMELSDVIKNTHAPTRRTSFLATPILLSSASPDNVTPSSSGGPKDTHNAPGSWFLFLSTSTRQHHQPSITSQEGSTSLRHGSDQDQYVCLHVHQSNVLGQEVLTRCRSSGNRRLLCRDVLVASTEEGVYLNADGFSLISVEDESQVESAPNLTTLSVLKVGTRLHSLVSVTGNICGVEEESAFSWPACPYCGNNHLDGGEGSGFVLHCSVCNEDINTPVMRMHLIVQITCPALPATHNVKIQLLQSTIESVLPSPSSQTSGGHDLHSTLGVLVGPINCLVRAVHETLEGKMFLLEEVLLCN